MPARYHIVYADGRRGGVYSLPITMRMIRSQRRDLDWHVVRQHGPAVAVEPVVGTEYQVVTPSYDAPDWHALPSGEKAVDVLCERARLDAGYTPHKLRGIRLRSPQ